MKRFLAHIWFRISGWKLKMYTEVSKEKTLVMIAAPHTSNWDFIYTMCAFWLMGINLKFFIKDSYTNGFFGFLFKYLGAIGVDRSKANNMVDYTVDQMKVLHPIVILIPAEGSRSRVDKWKTGFYHIAKKAAVDVALGYMDYDKKEVGVLKIVHPSDHFETDMDIIEKAYASISPKYPDLYNKKIY